MLKKIKDLTKEEMQNICENHYCIKCPLNMDDSHLCLKFYLIDEKIIKNKLKEK